MVPEDRKSQAVAASLLGLEQGGRVKPQLFLCVNIMGL